MIGKSTLNFYRQFLRDAARRISIFMGISLLAVLMGSCKQDVPQTNIGANLWPGYTPFFAAHARGSLKQHNAKVIQYPSASEVIRAFRNRTITVAGLTLDEMLLLRETRPDVCAFLVASYSNGADAVFSKPNIKSIADLRGRKVAVETGALGAYMLSRMLEFGQLELKDVTVINLDFSKHVGAYNSGEVDAVVTFEPVSSVLRESGANEIFSSREIPDEIVDVFAISREYFLTYRQHIERIVDVWFSVVELMHSNPGAIAEKAHSYTSLSPEVLVKQYRDIHIPNRDEHALLIHADAPKLLEVARKLEQRMIEKNLLRGKSKVDKNILCRDKS